MWPQKVAWLAQLSARIRRLELCLDSRQSIGIVPMSCGFVVRIAQRSANISGEVNGQGSIDRKSKDRLASFHQPEVIFILNCNSPKKAAFASRRFLLAFFPAV